MFGPGTIGSIVWLSRNPEAVARIRHGLVLTLLGGPGGFTYKSSRRATTEIDRLMALVLRDAGPRHELRPWLSYGYDERQYCSPGFNLAVGCLSRTPFGEFAEYHTSADNPGFVRPAELAQSLELVQSACRGLEHNHVYRNLSPYGEPQLGRRGLYKGIGGGQEGADWQLALLWLLSLADGQLSLLDVAAQSGLPLPLLHRAAAALVNGGLLEPLPFLNE